MVKHRKTIINAAVFVVKEFGSSALTIPAVAQQSLLTEQQVHEHFLDREQLLVTLFKFACDDYLQHLSEYRVVQTRGCKVQLNLLLVNLLEYRESDQLCGLFKELWALALHDKILRLQLDVFYRSLHELLVQRITEIAPVYCQPQQVIDACCILQPFIEGFSVLRPVLPVSILKVSEQVSEQVSRLLSER